MNFGLKETSIIWKALHRLFVVFLDFFNFFGVPALRQGNVLAKSGCPYGRKRTTA